MSNRDERPMTLVSRSLSAPARRWLYSPDAPRRLMFVNSFSAIPYALGRGLADLGQLDSIVLDGAATPDEFLMLLTMLPASFPGDVVLLQNDRGFVSTRRGEGRALKLLWREKIAEYLQVKMYVAASDESRRMPAVQ